MNDLTERWRERKRELFITALIVIRMKSASLFFRGNITEREMHIIVTSSVYHSISIRSTEMRNYVPILKTGIHVTQIENADNFLLTKLHPEYTRQPSTLA